VDGKLVMPAELQKIRNILLAAVVETISDEMRAVVESVWPSLWTSCRRSKPVSERIELGCAVMSGNRRTKAL
jgi:hypothetical protein